MCRPVRGARIDSGAGACSSFAETSDALLLHDGDRDSRLLRSQGGASRASPQSPCDLKGRGPPPEAPARSRRAAAVGAQGGGCAARLRGANLLAASSSIEGLKGSSQSAPVSNIDPAWPGRISAPMSRRRIASGLLDCGSRPGSQGICAQSVGRVSSSRPEILRNGLLSAMSSRCSFGS
jgi:hypothetical protein